MKRYIRTKEVFAEPMTAKKAIEKGYDVNIHSNDGYEVVYKNGFKSWCPKDIFDNAYRVADTTMDKLKIEIADLKKKIEHIDFWRNTDKFFDMSDTEKDLFFQQYNAMKSYLYILETRMILEPYKEGL